MHTQYVFIHSSTLVFYSIGVVLVSQHCEYCVSSTDIETRCTLKCWYKTYAVVNIYIYSFVYMCMCMYMHT